MKRILVIEPDSGLRSDLVTAVRSAGYLAEAVDDLGQALERVQSAPIAACLCDVCDEASLRELSALRKAAPRVALVAMGREPSVDLAVQAMKHGASDFLRKPFGVTRLEATLAASLGDADLAMHADNASPILSEDPGMLRLLRQAEAAAATEATVQIVGESGTGKDLLARFIHLRSARRSGAFVVVNCAALPEGLAESELFGHERGAFTGAVEARPGQILSAHGGSLLLDEVSELGAALQPKLLRVLQEREVLPVGAVSPRPVDVRIMATTQRDLAGLVANQRFREDLYFRLDVISLQVPPLRERPSDIPLLARHFLERFAKAQSIEPPRLGRGALAGLMQHPFRGNVRELENLMRRAVVLFPDREVDIDQLLSRNGGSERIVVPGLASLNLRDVERQLIIRSLAESGGNRTAASKLLGISVRTLRNKIRLYELT